MPSSSTCSLWFGTEEWMQWVATPLSGASFNPDGWNASGSFLNGGAYAIHSWGSAMRYDFEWRKSSTREEAALMHSYRNGTYGRGLIYFIDPLIYDQNILPKRWADPSMVYDDEGMSHLYEIEPTRVTNSAFKTNKLPAYGVRYDLAKVPPGMSMDDSVFIPIPEGYTLRLGAVHDQTGTGGVFYSEVHEGKVIGETKRLTAVKSNDAILLPDSVTPGIVGIRLWIGRTDSTASSLTLYGLIGRLIKTEQNKLDWTVDNAPPIVRGPWVQGQGHSGCRFDGNPTEVKYNGVNGGQVGYAVSFIEVGSWESS